MLEHRIICVPFGWLGLSSPCKRHLMLELIPTLPSTNTQCEVRQYRPKIVFPSVRDSFLQRHRRLECSPSHQPDPFLRKRAQVPMETYLLSVLPIEAFEGECEPFFQ